VTTDALWHALSDDLRAFLGRRVPEQAVDDLLQDVFLRVHTGIADVRDDERVAGWVFRIARNAVTDFYRRPNRTVPLTIEPASPPEEPLPIAATALARWTAGSIDTLPERYRDVLRLTELEQKPYREVARALGLSLSGVKTRVARGRELLRGPVHRCCEVALDARGGVVEVTPRPRPDVCC
jgi:RNA polymerase sigma-70 factor (ECF subfamily)